MHVTVPAEKADGTLYTSSLSAIEPETFCIVKNSKSSLTWRISPCTDGLNVALFNLNLRSESTIGVHASEADMNIAPSPQLDVIGAPVTISFSPVLRYHSLIFGDPPSGLIDTAYCFPDLRKGGISKIHLVGIVPLDDTFICLANKCVDARTLFVGVPFWHSLIWTVAPAAASLAWKNKSVDVKYKPSASAQCSGKILNVCAIGLSLNLLSLYHVLIFLP